MPIGKIARAALTAEQEIKREQERVRIERLSEEEEVAYAVELDKRAQSRRSNS